MERRNYTKILEPEQEPFKHASLAPEAPEEYLRLCCTGAVAGLPLERFLGGPRPPSHLPPHVRTQSSQVR